MTAPEPVIHVPDTPDAPTLAREFAALHTSELTKAARDIVELLVSEVVTNAYRHGRPPVRVAISLSQQRIRVEVHDHGPAFEPPVITQNDLDMTGGWGLAIVAGLSSSWGVTAKSWDLGKRVWFELDTEGPFPPLPGITR